MGVIEVLDPLDGYNRHPVTIINFLIKNWAILIQARSVNFPPLLGRQNRPKTGGGGEIFGDTFGPKMPFWAAIFGPKLGGDFRRGEINGAGLYLFARGRPFLKYLSTCLLVAVFLERLHDLSAGGRFFFLGDFTTCWLVAVFFFFGRL